MLVCSVIAIAIAIPPLVNFKVPTKDLVIQILTVFTICIPPSLPIAMSISVSLAIWRLKRNSIYCISSLRVTVAGKVGMVCFDKTGTLTENHLDMQTIVSATPKELQVVNKNFDADLAFSNPFLLKCVATCHNVTTMKGELVGDSMDVFLFQRLNAVSENLFIDKYILLEIDRRRQKYNNFLW